MKGTHLEVPLVLEEANDGNSVIAQFRVKGCLASYTKANAVFKSVEGQCVTLPIQPKNTNPINVVQFHAGHTETDMLSMAQSLHQGGGQELRYINFSNWFVLYSATTESAERNDFLATLGHLLGVKLYPNSVAIPSLMKADQNAHEQRILVAGLLATLHSLDLLRKSKVGISSHRLLPIELSMCRLPSKHWRKEDRQGDADGLELNVFERNQRLGTGVVEDLGKKPRA